MTMQRVTMQYLATPYVSAYVAVYSDYEAELTLLTEGCTPEQIGEIDQAAKTRYRESMMTMHEALHSVVSPRPVDG